VYSTVKKSVLRGFAFAVLASLMTIIGAGSARAQWATSSNNTTTNDNVGIGIATPSQMFHVHSLGTWAGMRVTTAATGTTINDGAHFGYDDAYGAYIWNREATSVVFSTSNTERARIDAAGSLGLGTSAPASKLHVRDTDATPDNEVFVETTAGNYGPTMRLKSSIPGQASDFLLTATAASNAGGAGAFRIYDYTANATRFFIAPTTGNIGIGTTSPGTQLDVGAGAAPRGSYSDVLVGAGGNNAQIELYGPTRSSAITHDETMGGMIFYTNGPTWTPSMLVSNAGNVGIGTTAPIHKVDVGGNMTIGSGYTSSVMVPANGLIVQGGVGIGTSSPDAQYKLDVVGDVRVSGNIAAKYQDVAEWVPSTQKLAAGTVVILDIAHDNHVEASTSSYDTRVAGVVSAQPGIALGEAGEGKALVATTGRVKVKVDATLGAIHVGDLLVTSDRAGYAMKSEPVLIGKRQFHSPGTIVGKALESLEKGTGEILVLLSLQ
jgi:hypothetical protein